MADSESEEQKPKNHTQDDEFIIPSSKAGLRICLQCGLAKSKKQWELERQCENCGTFMRIDTNQNTTTKFQGLIGLIDPRKSFIRKKAKVYAKNGKKLKSAAYGF